MAQSETYDLNKLAYKLSHKKRCGSVQLKGMRSRWGRLFILYLLTSWSRAAGNLRHRHVATTHGTVRGYFAPRPPHYAYRGVPYARPPTLYDRFKAPEPPSPWSGIFEATHRVKCPQPDGTGEENCLVVNVFSPEHAASQPVIVHFHGGGFQQGWGFHNSPRKLLEQGFVLVTFNYRIGVLGFLCLGLPDVPGNAGLKDQVAALYWVNRNIDKFGGNSSDVTVYGTGSGAVSIELLLFSGLTNNLFQKVILESGSALSPSAISYKPVLNALNFARNLGYKEQSELMLLQEYFYKVSRERTVNTSEMFLPCIESANSTNSLIVRDPREYLKSTKYQNVLMMIIYTNAEEISVIANDFDRFNEVPDSFENLLPNNIVFDSEKMRNKVASLVKDYYFDDHGITDVVFQSYIEYVNDIFMEYPILKSAANHAYNQNVVFLMKFLYKGRQGIKRNDRIPGASFGALLKYIIYNQFQDCDEIIAERLLTLWSNFIRLG
ncbi:jg13119 [Pararge aegeria aegeria]|uniref:Jg13119 protein n=1 Tax=Pararge aegeria aegeria TaxID=348720 RepID=A0A8S4RAE5_9NEOP|nr:jg13119 [Pararge aegeria aegeria]